MNPSRLRAQTSLQARWLARLEEAPDARCLAFVRPGQRVEWLSRDEVRRRTEAAAAVFRREGLRSGEACLIVLPSGEVSATALLAALHMGAVPLLVAPPTLLGGDRDLHEILRVTLRRTNARLVICPASQERELAHLREGSPSARVLFLPEGWRGEHGEAPPPALPEATAVAAMQLTSGTTAMPRVCVWDQRAVLAALDGMTAAMGLGAQDVCFNWTPLYHDMGLVNNFFLCLSQGVPLALLSPQDFIRRPATWLRGLQDTGTTVTWSPNFGFAVAARKAEESALVGVRLDGVRAFWNAAERIHLASLRAFHQRFAHLGVRWEALKTNFGCAENVGGATFSSLTGPARHEVLDRRSLDEDGVARVVEGVEEGPDAVSVVSTGRANPSVEIRIVSPEGEVLPDGEVGEICLDTPSRMLGYLENAEETRRALRDGVLHTSDLGYLRDGELFWVGRVRERITVQGKKIDPSAFEAVLADIPSLRPGCFVAFGVPDEALGTERVVVVSEVRDPGEPGPEELAALAGTVRRSCFLRLGIAPSDVVMVSPGTLAKTSSGKRRHRHFRQAYIEGELDERRLISKDRPTIPPLQRVASAEPTSDR